MQYAINAVNVVLDGEWPVYLDILAVCLGAQ
jgi:hypothetical protein